MHMPMSSAIVDKGEGGKVHTLTTPADYGCVMGHDG